MSWSQPHQSGGYYPPQNPGAPSYQQPSQGYPNQQQQQQHHQMSYQQPPPQGHYQQPYGGPPPQGQYGAPPPGQFGGPAGPQAPHGGYYQQQGPAPGQPGAPQYQQPYQAPYVQPTPPSLGYDPRQVANVNTDKDSEGLRTAMKGFGTDERKLIQILAAVPDPVIMAAILRNYNHRYGRDLLKDVEKETSGYFEEGLLAIIRGPLAQDVWNLRDALKGAGTKEDVLDDVLLGRSNADLNAIKAEYRRVYGKDLEADVRDDLSLKTEQLFTMVLRAQRAEESTQIIPQQLDQDVQEIYRATQGSTRGTDQIPICQIFSGRSDGQLRAIAQAYNQKHRTPLSAIIERNFTGHMKNALLRILAAAEDRAKADAQALEDAMKGAGTKDRLLVNRIVRLHWNKPHLHQVKAAYMHFHKRDLVTRVKGEVSGDYERLMIALLG